MPERTFTLLAVDDEPENLRYVSRVLRKDYQVLTADSGEDALKIANERVIDVLLSDQRMAGMRGHELLSVFKERFPKCLRLILSGYTDPPDLIAAINEGGLYGYLVKPITPEQLKLAIRQGLEAWTLKQEREELLAEVRRKHDALREAEEQLRQAVSRDEDTVGEEDAELSRSQLRNEALTGLADAGPVVVPDVGTLELALQHEGGQAKAFGHRSSLAAVQASEANVRGILRDCDVIAPLPDGRLAILLPEMALAEATQLAHKADASGRAAEFDDAFGGLRALQELS